MSEFAGRVAVITGAASGIGAALADEAAARGMSVILADINEGALDRTTALLRSAGADVMSVVTDVADAGSVAQLSAATLKRYERVDIVCNNAGVAGTFDTAWQSSTEAWQWVIGVNLWSVIHAIREFVPLMIDQGSGHVVNTASAAMFEAFPGMAPYGATKHAVLGLSEALRRELSGTGVGVSVLVPGQIVKTNILNSSKAEPPPGSIGAATRTAFTNAMAEGADSRLIAEAMFEGIRENRFLICDDPALLAHWGDHHAALARGQQPDSVPA